MSKFKKYVISNDETLKELFSYINELNNLSLIRINKLYGLHFIIGNLLRDDSIDEIIGTLSNTDFNNLDDNIYSTNSASFDRTYNLNENLNKTISNITNALNEYKTKNGNYIKSELKEKFELIVNDLNNIISTINEENETTSNRKESLINSINNIISENPSLENYIEDIDEIRSKELPYEDPKQYNELVNKLYKTLNSNASVNPQVEPKKYSIFIGTDPELTQIKTLLNTINSLYNNITSDDYISAISAYQTIINEFTNNQPSDDKEGLLNSIIEDRDLPEEVRNIVNSFISGLSFDNEYTYNENDLDNVRNNIDSLNTIINDINTINANTINEINSSIETYNGLVDNYNEKYGSNLEHIEFNDGFNGKETNNEVNEVINNVNEVLNKRLGDVESIEISIEGQTELHQGELVTFHITYLPENHRSLDIDNLGISSENDFFDVIEKELDHITIKVKEDYNQFGNIIISIYYNSIYQNVELNIVETQIDERMYFYYGNNDSILNRSNEEPISINYELAQEYTESELFNIEDDKGKYVVLQGSLSDPIKYILIKSSYVDNNKLYIRPDDMEGAVKLIDTTIYKDNEYTLLVFSDNGIGLTANERLYIGEFDESIIGQLVDIVELTGGEPPIDDESNYYWYVGTIMPTDPANVEENSELNTWTLIGTELPTSNIKVSKSDTNYELHPWYIAAPTDANFTLYNATNVASDEATWNKSTFNVGTIQYTLWTSKDQGWQAAEYLHK